MRCVYTAVLCMWAIAVCQSQCPPWHEWQAWSECNDGRWVALFDQLDIDIGGAVRQPPHEMLDQPRFPHMCGHCAWRMRVRKRAAAAQCDETCVESQIEPCAEYRSICSVRPRASAASAGVPPCAEYEHGMDVVRQCGNVPGGKDVIDDTLRRLFDTVPRTRCVHTAGGVCKCCCEPYEPDVGGTACVLKHAVSQCDAWPAFSQWSQQCIWFDGRQGGLVATAGQLCPSDTDDDFADIPFHVEMFERYAADFDVPERCGYCSFRVKCRLRSVYDSEGRRACFPMDMEKRACGQDDCDRCAAPCTLPMVGGSCNYLDAIVGASSALLASIRRQPYSMSAGQIKMLAAMPFGKCVQRGTVCKCCCHPYEPSDDGASCRLAAMCPSFVAAVDDATSRTVQTMFNLPKDEL